MNESSLKTLFHPFEAGLLDLPSKGSRTLFLNAGAGYMLPAGWGGEVLAVQDLRPAFLALERARHRVVPVAQDDGHDLALLLLGRHRGQNELWLADAIERTRIGGCIVVAGAKTDGAASLRKRVGDLVDIGDHASKNHGIVFWLTRGGGAEAAAAALRTANPMSIVEGFATVPGLFSHERVDPGSALLASALPDAFKGRAADFGAGWGYLSAELARRAPGIASIDLFEASFAACEAARTNMAALAPGKPCEIVWRDLLSEPVPRQYDVIVMNPPFHHGRAAEPAIGEGMIRAASAALKPGGRLWLVANRGLPYETSLQSGFARHGEAVRDDRFKVLWAVR